MPRISFPVRLPTAAIALVLCGAAVATSQAPVHKAPAVPGPAGLFVSDSALADGRRLLIVVDTATRHVAVYHVDAASGEMVLKSARDITWDLLVDEFNVREPRPAALEKMLQAAPPQAP